MRILFLAPRIGGAVTPGRLLASFHESDVQLLRDLGHEVDVLPWHGHPYLTLMRKALRSDLLYVWTVGDHTALALAVARLMHKPVLVVIGGYEFANLPDLHYGNLTHLRGTLESKFVWASKAHLLFVDFSLKEEMERAFGPRSVSLVHENGWEFPGGTYDAVIPTGYDPSYWHPDGKKENMVLTVAHCPGLDTLKLKGIDRFLDLAKHFPDWEFAIAGELPPIADGVPRNVVRHGWVERNEVRRLMQRAKVYCQLSRHEGLPNALAEAMLCGCIPVGSEVNGIPTLIGDAGFVTHCAFGTALGGALQLSEFPSAREYARDRIARLFPMDSRREALRRGLEELVR